MAKYKLLTGSLKQGKAVHFADKKKGNGPVVDVADALGAALVRRGILQPVAASAPVEKKP